MTAEHSLNVAEARSLSSTIMDTVPIPLIVLDLDLRVVVASRAFYTAFAASPTDTQGKLFHEINDGAWDIADLRNKLHAIVTEHVTIENHEV